MHRTTVVFAVVLLAVGSVFALPAIGGGRGLFRVQNALVEEDAGLTISIHALGRNPTFPSDSTKKTWIIDALAPELSYAPLATKWVGLELFANWGALVQLKDAPGDSGEFAWGMHDLRGSAKLSIPFIPVLKLGALGTYEFIERENKISPEGWLDPTAVPACGGFGMSWLATLQLQDLSPSLPNVMANYSRRQCYDVYGAGVELAASGFALFAEVTSVQPNDGTSEGIFDTDSGKVRLTPGVAFGTGTSGMTFKAGYTFAWGLDAPNELIAGLVIATPFGKRTPAQFGTIAGKVTDSRTGAVLGAMVTFPENPKMKPLTVDAATGVFSVDRVPAGVVVVEVSSDGYQKQAIPINVEDGGVAQSVFALRPLVTYGVIAGLVTDGTSGSPLAATIAFPESKLKSVSSTAGTGAFRVDEVPVGVYTVTAEAKGYFKGTQTVQVEDGKVATPKFALKTLTDVSTFTGRVSSKKDDSPLAATISFPGSQVASAKTAAGTGVFSIEMPVGSYAVKVEAEGYIAQTAALVVEKGKPQVRDFALVKEGMAITLRGVYFDLNKATIKPESHSALQDAANIMNENPTIRVEIQGHTDSQGSDEYNKTLSQRRAQSVVTYIIQNFGIAADRLVATGFGEAKPVADNATPEGRALNRRVEFVILGAKK